MVFNPNATKPGLSNRLWEVEGPCAAVANGYFVLQPNRVGLEDNEYGDEAVDFYGTSQVIDPRGNFVGERGSRRARRSCWCATSTSTWSSRCATTGSSTATAAPTPTPPIAQA